MWSLSLTRKPKKAALSPQLPPPEPPPEPVPVKKPVKKSVKKPADGWTIQPVDGEFARVIRRGIRAKRREKGRQGHRFRYDDVRELSSLDRRDEILVVVTHNEDKLWQYWRFDPVNGWMLESWHKTEREAKAEAEGSKPRPRPKPVPTPPEPEPGTYVSAVWAHPPYKGNRPMTVKCSSPYTQEIMSMIFKHLGCAVETKEVAAA